MLNWRYRYILLADLGVYGIDKSFLPKKVAALLHLAAPFQGVDLCLSDSLRFQGVEGK